MAEEVEQEQQHETEGQEAAVEQQQATPDPLEDLAREAGWSPKEEWRGNPDDWRDPKSFIQYGMKRSREGAEEIRGLKSTVDRIGRTAESLQKRAVDEAVREATERFNAAVEAKDPQAIHQASREIESARQPAQDGPDPSVADWASRNSSWFGPDASATRYATIAADDAARRGLSAADQVAYAEAETRKAFPHLFGQQREAAKPPAAVSTPQSRAANPTQRPKGFNDLPAEAQKAGRDFMRKGMVKTLDDYAKVYLEENA